MAASWDYIIVGAGSSGSVVAARLSEDPSVRVLLIEAGGSHRHPNVMIPAAFAKQFHTNRDWDYLTEPEPYIDNRRIYQPRAKSLGGCSTMNAMIYIRGNRADYDGWVRDGATGWSYDELLPLFKRTEHNSRGESEFHGASGEMHVQDLRQPNPLTLKMVEAAIETGHAANDDFNGPTQEGAGLYQVTHKRGARWTTADGFLNPLRKRDNVTIMAKTTVSRVVIEDGRAVGVEVLRENGREVIRSEREVILSAGAFGTPHLLMLSGIGPADHLRQHGIEVLVDNANVGSHLMDHPMFGLNIETTAKGTLAEAEHPAQLLKFLIQRKGLLTSNVAEGGMFFRTRSDDPIPDIQVFLAPAFFWEHGAVEHPTPTYAIGLSLVGSRSRGEVRLKSSSPTTLPAIRFDYFSDPADMDSIVAGLEVARDVAAAPAMKGFTGREVHFEGVKARADVEAAVRRTVEHTYHASCTARIGSEQTGVVGADLRVHGVAGLRVADASVFPTVPHGNTHAPAMVVGEKAADLIKAS
jgi:choline dehydrogenase-like flavoprotein